MKRIFEIRFLALLLLLPFHLTGCGENSEIPVINESIPDFILPPSIETIPGGTVVFDVKNQHAPAITDNISFESDKGISYICPVFDVTKSQFTITLNEGIIPGSYKVSLNHNDHKRLIGVTNITFVSELNFTPDVETTVYGLISDGLHPIPNVVVSDGYEVATTDSNGIYQLVSDKTNGYVFMSVPSGYEAVSEGVVPCLYKHTRLSRSKCERIDFVLNKLESQDNYTLLVCGDMHLANRTKDLSQFSKFTDEVNALVQSSGSRRVYALTLGDMSWDIYWDDNKFGLPEYLNLINDNLKGLQIFHTMGNHDNEYTATSDFSAEQKYRAIVAPTYYSFNLGRIHIVVLDDIDCSGYDGTTSRIYAERLTDNQFRWLEKDLQYVGKSTPIIIAMHAPLYKPARGSDEFAFNMEKTNAERLLNILDGYNVEFVTGHSHLMFNYEDTAVREHNSGAVCGSWWWSGYLTDGVHLCPDGTPGGYGIWNINGKNISRIYKAIGHDQNYQFRAYDLNKVAFSLDDVPSMPKDDSKIMAAYMKYANAYPGNNDNEVLINVWNWNPRWNIKVTTEQGNQLPVRQVWAYDPLHIAAMTVKRFNSSNLKSVPNFITEEYTHFFKVKAPDATSEIKITITDDCGNTYSETMKRPQDFVISNYKQSN